MKRSPLSAVAFWGTLGLNLALAAYSYARMPAQVASHFDASGAPNGWAPKAVLVSIHAGVVLLLGLLLVATGAALEGFPESRINLPNKDHWLAPERRAETFAWLRSHFDWFGAATFTLLLDLFAQILKMNLGFARGLEHPKVLLVCYVGFSLGWTAVLLRRFSLTD